MFCDKCGNTLMYPNEEYYHLETEKVLCEDCYFAEIISYKEENEIKKHKIKITDKGKINYWR